MPKNTSVADLLEILMAPPLEHMSIVHAREHFKKMLEQVHKTHILITNHGKPQAALIDYEAFQALQRLVLRLAQYELTEQAALKFEPAEHPQEENQHALEAVQRTRKNKKVTALAG